MNSNNQSTDRTRQQQFELNQMGTFESTNEGLIEESEIINNMDSQKSLFEQMNQQNEQKFPTLNVSKRHG